MLDILIAGHCVDVVLSIQPYFATSQPDTTLWRYPGMHPTFAQYPQSPTAVLADCRHDAQSR